MRKGNIMIPVLAMVGAVIVVGAIVVVALKTNLILNRNTNKPVACTADAKLCPDGSSVGRVAPNCDFAPCPVVNGNSNTTGTFNTGSNTNVVANVNSGTNVNAVVNTNVSVNTNTTVDPTAGWKTYTNNTYGFSFKYPSSMTLTENPSDLWQVAGVSDATRSMGLAILAGTLDPNNVQGMYGKAKTTTVSVGTQNGYQYTEGDAGCGGPAIQTPLLNNKILRIFFTVCEDGTNLLVTDNTQRQQILSMFAFME